MSAAKERVGIGIPRELDRGSSTAPVARQPSDRPPFFGALPARGIWTAVGLSRTQFLTILAASVVLFVVIGGPVWRHVRDPHFMRITVSYGVIPVGVLAALRRNGRPRLLTVIAASAVVALVKLVVTAALLIAFALARG